MWVSYPSHLFYLVIINEVGHMVYLFLSACASRGIVHVAVHEHKDPLDEYVMVFFVILFIWCSVHLFSPDMRRL